jgi:hypothetical protein
MLIYNRFATSRSETSAQTLRTFYDEFQEQFSEKTLAIPHLALSNGSVLNEDQGYSNSEILLNKTESIPYILEALQSIWMSSVGFNSCNPISEGDQKDLKRFKRVGAFTGTNVVKMRVKMYAAPGQASLYSSGTVFEKLFLQTFLWAPIWGNYSYFAATGLQDIDNAPGATGDFNSDDSENEMFEINYDKFCFIPTASSLGVPLWPNLKKDLSDVPQVVENNPTPAVTFRGAVISNEPGSTNTNQKHISLDANSALWWRYQTEKVVFDGWETDQPFELTDIYHIGEGPIHMPPNMDISNFIARRCENVINHDLTLDQQGELWIGRDANLGIVPTPGNPLNEADRMKVIVAEDPCDQAKTKVLVRNGSALMLGDNNSSGELLFNNNTELNVEGNARVELDNKSRLTIDSGATAYMDPSSFLLLKDSSQLIIESGATLKVSESAELIARLGSSIIVKSGGKLEVEPSASVNIRSGSKLTLEPDGELIIPANAVLSASGNGFVYIHENSSLRIQTNGVLDLSSGNVLVSRGATLFLEKSPIVTLDSESKIELRGGYVFEGEVIFQAPNGYLDIFHSLYDIRSIEGSVSILGSNRENKILKLRKHVRFQMFTQDLTLRDGTVEIGSEFSSIRSSTMSANSNFILENVDFKGVKQLLGATDPHVFYRYGTAYGLELGGVSVLDVENCSFTNLTKGIILRSGTAGNTIFQGDYNIVSTKFNEVIIGIETESVEQIHVLGCTFENYGVQETRSTIGVFTSRTNHVDFSGSRIENFKYGIRTKDVGNLTNIEMLDCAEIIGCSVGVYGYNANFKMRNSSFFYNQFCVAGYDVYLDIPSTGTSLNQFVHCTDASGNTGFTGNGPSSPPVSNQFEQNFILQYSSGNSELWGGHGHTGRNTENGEGGIENIGLEGEAPRLETNLNGTSSTGGTGGGNGPDISAIPDPPYYGPEIVLPPYIDPQQECGFIFSIANEDLGASSLIPAENNYWVVDELEVGVHYAITYFNNVMFLDYEPLVLLPSLPGPGDCPIPLWGGVNGRFSDSPGELKVFPNPAQDQITVELPYDAEVRVINTIGQIIYQETARYGTLKIPCNSWSPGLYFLRLDNGQTYHIIKI